MSDSALRSVLITGASTGIGQACALELDRLGWRVLAGIRAEADAERLRSLASPSLVPLEIDVTQADSIAAAARKIGELVGSRGLDGLVNNAGIVIPGPLELVPVEQLRKQFEVNVFGQMAVTQAMLPMLRAARGRIVNMGSIAGRVASPYLGPYAASKHALEAITDSLRVELRRWGISVSIVEPGSVQTPIWQKARTSADTMAQRIDPAKEGLYAADLDAMRESTDTMARWGMPVKYVVRAVVHAIVSRRPKTRYPVGPQTRLAFFAFKFLDDRTRDWVILRRLGLK